MLNKAHTSDRDVYYNHERPSIVNLIKPGPNVILDLGCGSGAVGKRLLRDGKAVKVVGAELFASAAEQAKEHYAAVHVGDIEEMELPYKGHFDYALCGDVLEHLKDPYTVVKRIHGWLKDDGHLICSLPNVRHWGVILKLAFRGAWEYQDAGIMDRTHLRFFTRKSCFEMLRNGGFEVERHRMLIWGRKYQLLNRLTLGTFDELFGSQILTLSRKRAVARRDGVEQRGAAAVGDRAMAEPRFG